MRSTTRTDTESMKVLRTALLVLTAVASSACTNIFKDLLDSPTSPSEPGAIRSYLGTWAGPATGTPTGQSCANLQWKITSQTGGQASGDFAATCADGVALAGTMTATHSDTTIPWAASGTATKGSTTCPFNMTGTGTFQGTSNIALNYAGTTTCLGPFSGSETITR
jgi:hypothetical protein